MITSFYSPASAIESAIKAIENIALLLATADDDSLPSIQEELDYKNALDDSYYAFESMALGSFQLSKNDIR